VKKLGSLALRFGVSAALIGWLLTRVDLGAVGHELGDFGIANVLLVLALQLVNTALKSYKWQQLMSADGIRMSHATAFASYMVGTFFSVFLPTAIGGDAVRAVDAGRRSGRGMATATSVVADRVLGFAAIGIVGLAALVAGAASSLEPHLRALGAVLYLAVLAAAALAFTNLSGFVAERLAHLGWSGGGRALRTIAQSIASYRESGGLLRWTLLSIFAQIIVVVAVWVIAGALEIRVSLPYFFAIVPLVSLVESLPVSVFGIGTRDVSYVYLLGLAGVPQAKALSLSFLYVLLSLFYALLGGVVFALRGSPAPRTETVG
jgi:uncharacterized membrane protein YbhN (UPF0104 family)